MAAKHADIVVQSHISESHDAVAFSAALHPEVDGRDAQLFDAAGLLRSPVRRVALASWCRIGVALVSYITPPLDLQHTGRGTSHHCSLTLTLTPPSADPDTDPDLDADPDPTAQDLRRLALYVAA